VSNKINDELKQLLTDYNVTFHSECGERVLEDLKAFCGYNNPCFVRGEPDLTALNLGQRNVFLRILNFLSYSDKKERQEVIISE
jgi:hypothetical protein